MSLLAAPAYAQQEKEATRLFNEGMRLYEDKQYAEACPLLERSLAAAPLIRTRGALALCHEKSGRLARAYAVWQEVVVQAKQTGAAEEKRGRFAQTRMDQLRPKIAMVSLKAADAPTDLQVVLDGQPADLTAPFPLDAGAHVLEARAPGRLDWRQSFELGKADEGKTREIPIGPLEVIRAPEPVVTPPPVVAAPIVDEGPRRNPTFKWLGIGAAGAGVVALAVGSVFAVSAGSSWDDAKATGCDDKGTCPTQEGADLVNDAGSKATISTVTFVAGGALVVGGTLLFLFAPKEQPGATRAAVVPTTTGAMFFVHGTL